MTPTVAHDHSRNELELAIAREKYRQDPSTANLRYLADKLRLAANGYYWGKNDLSNIEKNVAYNLEAAGYYSELNNHHCALQTLNRAGVSLGSLGNHAKASEVFQQAKQLLDSNVRELNEASSEFIFEYVRTLFYLSVNLSHLDKHAESLKMSRRGLKWLDSRLTRHPEKSRYEALFDRNIGITLSHIGSVRKSRRYKTLAFKHLSGSVKKLGPSGKNKDIAVSLKEIGKVCNELGKPIEALEVLNRADKLYGHPNSWLHFHRAKAYVLLKKYEEAEKDFETAISQVESGRVELEQHDFRKTYFLQTLLIYDAYIDLLEERGRTEKAFELVQRSKARSFWDVLSKKQLAGETTSASYVTGSVASLKQIQASLGIGQGIIEYYLGKKNSRVYLVTKDALFSRTVSASVDAITNEVEILYGFLKQVQTASSHQWLNWRLRKIYDLLIGPVQDELKPLTKLIIVPNRDLYRLPFAALQSAERRSLAEDKVIRYMPCSSMALLPRVVKKVNLEKVCFLGFGNPTGGLQYAETETTGVSQLFANKKLYLKQDATKNNLMNELRTVNGEKILHIACHGKIAPNDPLGGWLELASPDNGDGKLRISDVYKIKGENLALAFLSGCYTGQGKMEGGDEVQGLSRAFLTAGAKSVVVSLWDVEESSTSDLVWEFYKNLHKGMSTDESLQKAQIACLKKNPHPYFWAAFQVVG